MTPITEPVRYYRKVIRITAEDSPNVRYAQAQIRAGIEPTNKIIIPGVLPWADYKKRRLTWDKIRQCIGLDGQFWEGAELLLFPPEWLNRAEALYRGLLGRTRKALAIGVDPAEGGDKTAMVAIDHLGIIEISSRPTPDTSVIVSEVLAFMRKHDVPDTNVMFDRGGGGQQRADDLRAMGHKVRSVGFGEPMTLEPQRGTTLFNQRLENREDRYVYVNRRAQMYWELSMLMDPNLNPDGFGIPPDGGGMDLRRQLAPIPKLYEPPEGRCKIPPKNRKGQDSKETCLVDLIGHSPDEADALVLAVHAMLNKPVRRSAGAA